MLFERPQKDDDSTENNKVKIDREKFFGKHSIDSSRLANIWGIHGAEIYRVKESDLPAGSLNPKTRIKNKDGLITDVSNSYLMVTGADCFPILICDSKRKAVGGLHAGWRGILAGIASKAVVELRKAFNSVPGHLNVWIGPGIKSCHFEVKEDVVKLFKDYARTYTDSPQHRNSVRGHARTNAEIIQQDIMINRDGRYFIDLPAIIKRQLVEAGIEFRKITEHTDCTYCKKNEFFSYRRDKPNIIEANALIIHLKRE